MRISDIQDQAKALRKAQGWVDLSPEKRLAYLMTEIGEVAEETLSLSSARDEAEVAAMRERLGMEIYDAVWNLCDLANILNIDLDAAFEKKAAINRARQW